MGLYFLLTQLKKEMLIAEFRKIMSITLKIKKIRRAKGYSQEYMAYRLGVTQSAYSKMEKNDRLINFQNIDKIATILEMKTIDIILSV